MLSHSATIVNTSSFNQFEQCGEYSLNPTQAIINLCMAIVATQCTIATKYIDTDINFDNIPADTYYDFIVIGAGPGGSTVASQLAAHNSNWNILLIEAGDNPPFDSYVTPFGPRILRTHYDWKFEASAREENVCGACPKEKCVWSTGRMLGGSSALGIQFFQIGNKNNYNEWAEWTKSSHWRWDSVRKYFERLIEIVKPEFFEQREKMGQYSEVNRIRNLLIRAGQDLGLAEITSFWDQIQSRVGYQRSYGMLRNGVRCSAATVFLNGDQNQLKNLHILKKTIATKILFDKDLAVAHGVEIQQNGIAKIITTKKEVILSAGTFNTPKLLMLSGIGSEEYLKTLEINTIVNLPAVGKHLQDHTKTLFFYRVTNSNFTISRLEHYDNIYRFFMHQDGALTTHGATNIAGFINTNNQTARYPNLKFIYSYKPIDDPIGLPTLLNYYNFNNDILNQILNTNKHSAILTVMLNNLQTQSRGEILIKSTNAHDKLKIKSNFNTHATDVAQILKGIRFTQQLLRTKTMRNVFKFEPIIFNLDKCEHFAFDSDDYWKCYIKYFTISAYSTVGTARMGCDTGTSVVTDQLKVHGVQGLRIVDGSVLPKITTGYTEAPIMMIGLKAADMILDEWMGVRDTTEKDEL